MPTRRTFIQAVAAVAFAGLALTASATAASRAELDAAADATLAHLSASEPVTEEMLKRAAGVLVFPRIVKGGFIVGVEGGEGVLREKGRTVGVYRTTGASFGFQAGLSQFGYVMVLMDDDALDFVRETRGWEVGVGPNVTVADRGIARKLSSSSVQQGIYVFFLDQKGLFAGAGLQGSRISRVAD